MTRRPLAPRPAPLATKGSGFVPRPAVKEEPAPQPVEWTPEDAGAEAECNAIGAALRRPRLHSAA